MVQGCSEEYEFATDRRTVTLGGKVLGEEGLAWADYGSPRARDEPAHRPCPQVVDASGQGYRIED